jgi:SAM-dependent methyltransferase
MVSGLSRRARHGVRLLLTPSLWGEELEYLRHGPSPDAPAVEATIAFPDTPRHAAPPGTGPYCNICGWEGAGFDGDRHVEGQLCPRCRSNGRDRFLFHCFVARTPPQRWLRVLETSPRLGDAYRYAMDEWFCYLASDFDQSLHRASIRLDLQDIDLPPRSLDVVLTAHVLEHVPDTDRALTGLRRVLAPGGRLYLQVPVLQGATTEPATPEYHEDHTRVAWRFGFDLAGRLRRHGFTATVLVTEPFVRAVREGDASLVGGDDSEWDVPTMVAAAKDEEVVSVLDQPHAERLGLWESYQFVTFEGIVPHTGWGAEAEARARRAWQRLKT